MRFDLQRMTLYLMSRLFSPFLPRKKRRALRRHYNWLYGRITAGWAREMFRQKRAFESTKESLLQVRCCNI